MTAIGYIPYKASSRSMEADWLARAFGCQVFVARNVPSLNLAHREELPDFDILRTAAKPLLAIPWVVAEGPGGFLWAAILRLSGYDGGVTILPYLNPSRWYDIACIASYLRFADPRDRIFLGSTPSARIYRALGVNANVGEPYGIDCDVFHPRPDAAFVLGHLSIPRGRVLLFAGRAQPDKNLYRFLRIALRARLLFPDLNIVIASHVMDDGYLADARRQLGPEDGVYFVVDPLPDLLANLYNVANVFATPSTSHYETFGRAPAEALACGTPAVAPRYDGFAEILAQPGGTLVDVEIEDGIPEVNEAHMLRAIYDILSSSAPVPSERIAAIARQRFCRSETLRLLEHVVTSNPGTVTLDPLVPAQLSFPLAWTNELCEMAQLPSLDAVTRLWTLSPSKELELYDNELRTAIRLCLFQSARELSEKG